MTSRAPIETRLDPPRPWSRSAAIALLVIYLPAVTPFVHGPLSGCDHCVATYLKLMPLLPGAAAALCLAFGNDALFLVAGGAVQLGLLAMIAGAARRFPTRELLAVCLPLMLLCGVACYALGAALRA